MNFVGVDLHKRIIVVCVLNEQLRIVARQNLYPDRPEQIVAFFRKLGSFRVVIEATASYRWLAELLERLAERIVLANPKKLRVIAESTKKTDRLDAQVLAEFLARDMIPEAYMPTPRQRQHRALMRHRQYIRGRISSVKCKIRRILSDYNADRKDLFTGPGKSYFKQVPLSDIDRFTLRQLWSEYEHYEAQLREVGKKIKSFVAKAPAKEAEARKNIKTAPGMGPVTTEVILSELGDVKRFRNAKAVCAYAGLVPAVRQSGGKRSKDLHVTKEGSPLLRWALVEAAWRVVYQKNASIRWTEPYFRLQKHRGAKRAIVAIARKLLCALYAMLRTEAEYRAHPPCPAPRLSP